MITAIKIKIGKKGVECTIEEIKELKAALDEIFREPEKRTEYVPYPVPQPIAPRYPYWWDTYGTARPMWESNNVTLCCESKQ